MPGCGWLGQLNAWQLNGVVDLSIELCAGFGDTRIGAGIGPVAAWICAAADGANATDAIMMTLRISI